jgi:hypothetical protein
MRILTTIALLLLFGIVRGQNNNTSGETVLLTEEVTIQPVSDLLLTQITTHYIFIFKPTPCVSSVRDPDHSARPSLPRSSPSSSTPASSSLPTGPLRCEWSSRCATRGWLRQTPASRCRRGPSPTSLRSYTVPMWGRSHSISSPHSTFQPGKKKNARRGSFCGGLGAPLTPCLHFLWVVLAAHHVEAETHPMPRTHLITNFPFFFSNCYHSLNAFPPPPPQNKTTLPAGTATLRLCTSAPAPQTTATPYRTSQSSRASSSTQVERMHFGTVSPPPPTSQDLRWFRPRKRSSPRCLKSAALWKTLLAACGLLRQAKRDWTLLMVLSLMISVTWRAASVILRGSWCSCRFAGSR